MTFLFFDNVFYDFDDFDFLHDFLHDFFNDLKI